jgi:hypothetical protein
LLRDSQDSILSGITTVVTSDIASRILISCLMVKWVIWEGNLVASASRGFIPMNLNGEGYLRSMH